jgi:hypothetical protein
LQVIVDPLSQLLTRVLFGNGEIGRESMESVGTESELFDLRREGRVTLSAFGRPAWRGATAGRLGPLC